MRTTLTLDDDLAQRLQDISRERDTAFKQVVNEAIRRGIDQMDRPQKAREAYRTVPIDLGKCFLPNLDNIEEALDYAEGYFRR